MNGKSNVIKTKIMEALSSVAPVTLIVLILCFTIAPIDSNTLVAFIVGAVLLVVGMGLFSLGVENSMTIIGERVGSDIVKSRKLILIVVVALILGFIITISEPDLTVLAGQLPSIPGRTLIYLVGVGVGIFLTFSLLRILFRIRLKWMLIVSYAAVFILAIFVPKDFIAVAFDSGGVTTGPMTVPFILALGVGVSSIRSDDQGSDSFGLVALSSVGPILMVMILGLVYHSEGTEAAEVIIPQPDNTVEMMKLFTAEIPDYVLEVGKALLPIFVFFLVFQVLRFKMSRRNLIKIIVGLIYTYGGLVCFLTGVNVGFMPAGNHIGEVMGSAGYRWLCIPVAMLIGYYIVKAEPAVHVMTKQVNEVTAGAISEKMLFTSLSVGMSVSLGISMLRALTGISILYFLIPGYLIAILLMFVVPDLFTAIAFDSGGVASGPMTATFLLPFTMGVCGAVGGNIATDAFGVVAMVAMTPLITIQVTGLIYTLRRRRLLAAARYPDLAAIDREENVVLL